MEKLKNILVAVVTSIVVTFIFLFKRRGDKIDKLNQDIIEAKGEALVYQHSIDKQNESKKIESSLAYTERDDIIRMLDKDGTLRRSDKPD